MIHFKAIGKIMGALLVLLGSLMLPAAAISFHFGEDSSPMMISSAISLIFGLILFFSFSKQDQLVRKREGYMIVALSWILMTIFGMIPFVISDYVTNNVDALFETVSGLTTTGATVLKDIEAMPKGLLFWRSMTQWVGGLGIIVLTVAIFPLLGIGGIELFVAESPGPTSDKVHPRISETAKRLWFLYVGLTLLCGLLYWGGGMSLFDAANHAFTTLASGGFSTRNASLAYYDSAFLEYIAIIFMFLAGANFSMIYFGLVGKFKRILKNDEFKTYAIVLIAASLILAVPVFLHGGSEVEEAFRKSAFQVVSVVTTTGFITDDYTRYGEGMSFAFFMLLFAGGCAGSTAGGIKFIRHTVFLKNTWLEFKRIVHPRAIVPLIINGERVTGRIINNIMNFLLIYLLTFVVGAMVMSLLGYDLATSLGAVAACLSNVGPAIGKVGPMDNYAFFSPAAKIVLSAIMLLGRLELFTILILFTPFFWRYN
jgi:trk system potassium uptake protein TrkH